MCGLVASIKDPRVQANGSPNGISVDKIKQQLEKSLELIKHRGPDGSGIWVSPDGNVALGHCRLAINDLSANGLQPLASDDGQIHAIVIGTVYCYDALRKECQEQHGYRFSSHSDSELVLALYKAYGAPGFLQHLRGEFALVLHDGRTDRVVVARDRFGIKPLFWTELGGRLLVAAEAKAFLGLGWQPRWDVKSLVTSAWEMEKRTAFRGVSKVLPGEWVDISAQGVKVQKYWDPEYADKVSD
ncbi:hypothetical protein CDD81_2083 [Ophiocordyceps australis]|uniref:Glutamine amidotransferase type-2 domain-containing protein n=1 Tax=Ophiocordyceps australis TaxID=1399860 RepID=A0A2C5XS82_9HYPO|nr:hypothetical protein CDD81_2083 [Ophiocordyceps australis]